MDLQESLQVDAHLLPAAICPHPVARRPGEDTGGRRLTELGSGVDFITVSEGLRWSFIWKGIDGGCGHFSLLPEFGLVDRRCLFPAAGVIPLCGVGDSSALLLWPAAQWNHILDSLLMFGQPASLLSTGMDAPPLQPATFQQLQNRQPFLIHLTGFPLLLKCTKGEQDDYKCEKNSNSFMHDIHMNNNLYQTSFIDVQTV